MQHEETGGLMTTGDLVAYLRLSRTVIWRNRRDGNFPAPCEIGSKHPRWRRKDIEHWIAGRTTSDPVRASKSMPQPMPESKMRAGPRSATHELGLLL